MKGQQCWFMCDGADGGGRENCDESSPPEVNFPTARQTAEKGGWCLGSNGYSLCNDCWAHRDG